MRKLNIVVIGSGVMGSGIAAQIANSGCQVHLLDIVLEDKLDRNFLATQAIAKLKNSNAIAAPELLSKIIPGNLIDDEVILKSADWIIEVIIEDLSVKLSLYNKLQELCKKDCIISSNTSTIPLKKLIADMSENFKQHFLITHFFNPPRFMPLLELVASQYTKKEVIDVIESFIDNNLGKYIVRANDTPGFIANRIGCYWLMIALDEALKNDITIEDIDYLMGEIIGIPKTAVFGLYDLIGIDVMQLIAKSLCLNLNQQDEFVQVSNNNFSFLTRMVDLKLIGRKANAGFYRIKKNDNGNKITEVLDLKTLKYRAFEASKLQYLDIRDLVNNNNAWNMLSKVLVYVAKLIPDISDNISSVDQAMKLGYNWKFGPFELVDLIGVDFFKQKLIEQNRDIPRIFAQIEGNKFYQQNNYFTLEGYKSLTRAKGVIYLKDLQHNLPILSNEKCAIWENGGNTAFIELKSKMGILHQEIFHLIAQFIDEYSYNFQAIVIVNSQENFSVGGDLKFMLEMAKAKNWQAIDDYLKLGQQTMLKIKNSPIPIISAVKGMALGGGSELLLHSKATVAHIDVSAGLVEAGVGLVPAWGGCKEMILRSQSMEELNQAFNFILNASILSSAYDLQNIFKLSNLSIIMNKSRVLSEAINRSSLAESNPLKKQVYKFDLSSLNLELTGYNLIIAQELAEIFMLSHLSEQDILEQERAVFIKLLHNQITQDKIAYTLATGKRLKN